MNPYGIKLWLKDIVGECLICGEDMRHFDTKIEDGQHRDEYYCDDCEIGVTYITPVDDGKEYHEYNQIEIDLWKF